uniref:Uncharacterized protein n=1 Tax=Anopheles darlingi TaxID=43151 RepID=A0A2M4D915_ANODA
MQAHASILPFNMFLSFFRFAFTLSRFAFVVYHDECFKGFGYHLFFPFSSVLLFRSLCVHGCSLQMR